MGRRGRGHVRLRLRHIAVGRGGVDRQRRAIGQFHALTLRLGGQLLRRRPGRRIGQERGVSEVGARRPRLAYEERQQSASLQLLDQGRDPGRADEVPHAGRAAAAPRGVVLPREIDELHGWSLGVAERPVAIPEFRVDRRIRHRMAAADSSCPRREPRSVNIFP